MSHPSEAFIALCTRSLSGEASPAERRRLDVFLRRPDYRAYYEELRARWSAAREPVTPAFDMAGAYERLRGKLAMAAPASTASPVLSLHRIGRTLAPWLAAAALVAIGLGLSIWYPRTEARVEFPPLQQRVTAPGERSVVVLADGTRVILNGASSLTFPPAFGRTRAVRLRGEAFFEVAHDPAHPFVVDAGGLRATVLGTTFNVAVAPGRQTAVALLEGRVQIESLPVSASAQPVLLRPREQYTLDPRSGVARVTPFDREAVMAWQRGAFVFRETPLADAAAQLERKFGVGFDFADPSLAAKAIDAHFERESLAEILQVLSFAGGLRCEPVREHGAIIRVRISSADAGR